MGVDHGWSVSSAAPLHRFRHGIEAGKEVCAIDLCNVKVRKSPDQGRYFSARRLAFDGRRDRPAVILYKDQERKAFEAGKIECFPELTFTGGAIARTDQSYFIAGRM